MQIPEHPFDNILDWTGQIKLKLRRHIYYFQKTIDIFFGEDLSFAVGIDIKDDFFNFIQRDCFNILHPCIGFANFTKSNYKMLG